MWIATDQVGMTVGVDLIWLNYDGKAVDDLLAGSMWKLVLFSTPMSNIEAMSGRKPGRDGQEHGCGFFAPILDTAAGIR